MKTIFKVSGLALSCLVFGLAIGYYAHFSTPQAELVLPKEVIDISRDVTIIVKESDVKNRTLLLNTSKWYCKATAFTGGSSPKSWDLADPNGTIIFFFLEDIEDSAKADNYGDLIVRMNPVIENGSRKMVLVFYAEGGYDKFVYYGDQLFHHYSNGDPESNYGIRLIDSP